MVYIELHCRLGNQLFQMAAGETLARLNNTHAYCYITDENVPEGTLNEYVEQFKKTIFAKIDFVESVPENIQMLSWQQFDYKEFPKINSDVIIVGAFQSYKYFDEQLIKELYAIPKDIKTYIDTKYGSILSQNITAIHIRRGDYMAIPHKFPVCSLNYFRKAIKIIGEGKFLIISDDIPWCKAKFKGDSYYFSEKEEVLVDLYLLSSCKNVIMSNSSFSWWGAYLNPHKDKIIIAPKNWFGISQETNKHNIKDLTPTEWIKIYNRMELSMLLKSWKMTLKEYFLGIIERIKT